MNPGKSVSLVSTLALEDQHLYRAGALADGQKLWRSFYNERILRAVAQYVNTKGHHDIDELARRIASLPVDR